MNNLGTWIDWQYLQNAAKLLAKVCTPSLFQPCQAQTSEGGRHCRGQGAQHPVQSCMLLLMGPHFAGLCPLRTQPSVDVQGILRRVFQCLGLQGKNCRGN